MLLSDRILFGSFAFIEFTEKIPVVTFSKTLSEITERYCVVE